MSVTYTEYFPKRILNRHKHTDGPWFWIRYTANPYIGCEHACEYCYTVMDKYNQFDVPEDFCRAIKVKVNAAELLRKELARVQYEGLALGDYQPAEEKYKLSRKMLEVASEFLFPIFLLEKSDLLLRDLDILKKINTQSQVCVAFSIITPDDALAQKIEPKATPPSRRFQAIKKLSEAGILCGVCQIPILPGITDDDASIEEVIRRTAENSGSFVLAGGLTLHDNCGVRFRKFISREFPELVSRYKNYSWQGTDFQKYWLPIAKKVTALCDLYNIHDSIPRYIPNNRFAVNKRVSEILFHITRLLELVGAENHQVWAFRKAAWAVEELETDIRLVQDRGALQQIENIGASIAKVIDEILEHGESSLYKELSMEWRRGT